MELAESSPVEGSCNDGEPVSRLLGRLDARAMVTTSITVNEVDANTFGISYYSAI